MNFEKVNEIPNRTKAKNEYRELLKNFYEAKIPKAKITEMPDGKMPSGVATYAANVAKNMGIPIKVVLRKREVFLINTELLEGEL